MTDYLPKLERYIAQSQRGAQITHFENITSGWENEVYAFTLRTGDYSRDLILRIYPGQNAQTKAEREFKGMQYLYSVEIPRARDDRH